MRVFLTVLLVAAARADKPAVAPAYTGAASVDETFGSTLKRDAPAAAAPDSYGSPIVAPSQDTYGSPSAPLELFLHLPSTSQTLLETQVSYCWLLELIRISRGIPLVFPDEQL